MKKLKLKRVKITFEGGIIKAFGGYDNIDHVETDMICGGKIFRIQVIYENLDNILQHIETYKFNTDDILSIEQIWV